MSAYYLGVDFGTTNSVISMYDTQNDKIRVIPIDGGNIFPSAVQFELDNDEICCIFGAEAKDAAIIFPESTVLSVKRLLGSNNEIKLSIDGNEHIISPKHIAAYMLAYIKQTADKYLTDNFGASASFSGVCITVPANSTDRQKKTTKDAAVLAGFDEDIIFLRLEPAAAAISYAVSEKTAKNVLIYDFGGGTFDACVLQIEPIAGEPVITILSTYGDNLLGGDDVDKIIIDIIYEYFKEMTDNRIDLFDFSEDDELEIRSKKTAITRLRTAATEAKERLNSAVSAKITIAPLISDPIIVNLDMELTRDDFYTHRRKNTLGDPPDIFRKFENKNLYDLLNMTFVCVDESLTASALTVNDIDEVFLVGGSSNIEQIAKKITDKFGFPPFLAKISPALCISQGAALYCKLILSPTEKDVTVCEKTVHSLGLEIAGRKYMEIISAGQIIPNNGLVIEAPELLSTNFNDLTSMQVSVYENTLPQKGIQSVTQDGMKKLGSAILSGIPKAAKGKEKVRVVFYVGLDNILKVTARSESETGSVTELIVNMP